MNSNSTERTVVLSYVKLLNDEQQTLSRYNFFARFAAIVGWALLFFTVFKYYDKPVVPRDALWLPAIGGSSAAIGAWLRMFVNYWPISKRFIDVKAVERRAKELEIL